VSETVECPQRLSDCLRVDALSKDSSGVTMTEVVESDSYDKELLKAKEGSRISAGQKLRGWDSNPQPTD
jgi:hypothetical protein